MVLSSVIGGLSAGGAGDHSLGGRACTQYTQSPALHNVFVVARGCEVRSGGSNFKGNLRYRASSKLAWDAEDCTPVFLIAGN